MFCFENEKYINYSFNGKNVPGVVFQGNPGPAGPIGPKGAIGLGYQGRKGPMVIGFIALFNSCLLFT